MYQLGNLLEGEGAVGKTSQLLGYSTSLLTGGNAGYRK